MTGRSDGQGVAPSSGKDNTLDANAWQRWQSGLASAEEIQRWQQQLSQRLPQLPKELLEEREVQEGADYCYCLVM